jgi:hypothetical protein
MAEFSRRHKFSDWPDSEVPAVGSSVYAVWDGEILIYCGRSGREFEKAVQSARVKFDLVTRLARHASGRLGGDSSPYQFCVYERRAVKPCWSNLWAVPEVSSRG